MVNVGKYKIVTFLVSSEDKRPKSKTYRAFYNTRRRKMYENKSKTLRKGKYVIVNFFHQMEQQDLKTGHTLKMHAVNQRGWLLCALKEEGMIFKAGRYNHTRQQAELCKLNSPYSSLNSTSLSTTATPTPIQTIINYWPGTEKGQTHYVHFSHPNCLILMKLRNVIHCHVKKFIL